MVNKGNTEMTRRQKENRRRKIMARIEAFFLVLGYVMLGAVMLGFAALAGQSF
jgi:hypothetical protein